MPTFLSAEIIILNYRGASLLPQCLPSIVAAAQKSSFPTTVTILNNPSHEKDEGLDYVRQYFPSVRIFQASQNLILCSYNEYLPMTSASIVILLNNDIRVAVDFVDPLIRRFQEDDRTFLTAPKVMDFEGKHVTAGASKAGVRFGLFWCESRYPGYEKDVDQFSETFSSGFGAFDRVKFLELGGYRSFFHPGIMEDVDLCFRARQKGFRLYYEPHSVVYHVGQASFFKEYGNFQTAVIAHRNSFIFMWKNFEGLRFWISHLFFLPLRLMWAMLSGNWPMVRGFIKAVKEISRL